MDYVVFKLGGSILRNRESFLRAVELVQSELEAGRIPICVVSAVKGVTDRLIAMIEGLSSEEEGSSPESMVSKLLEEHAGLLPQDWSRDWLSTQAQELTRLLKQVRPGSRVETSLYAAVVSRGECFSGRVLEAHLKDSGIGCQFFVGEDLLVTDENCLDASVDLDETRSRVVEKLAPALEAGLVPVVAGFAGRSRSGVVTILGRGGTDDTAVCLAYALSVRKVIKFVAEGGVYSLDPGFSEALQQASKDTPVEGYIPPPRLVPYLNYQEALALFRAGRAKVVHYKVLEALMRGGLELHLKGFHRGDSGGTIIGPSLGEMVGAKAISYQKGLRWVYITPNPSRQPCHVLAEILDRLSKVGVDIRFLSETGHRISFLVAEADWLRAVDALQELNCILDVESPPTFHSTLSIVGSQLDVGFVERIRGLASKHNLRLIPLTPDLDGVSLRFCVRENDLGLAVFVAHRACWEGAV